MSTKTSIVFLSVLLSCHNINNIPKGTYGYDRTFLKEHNRDIIELYNNSGARVLLSATDQGRVLTSTAQGDTGRSFGWINYDLIASEKRKKQFNPIGGEERFWMGPEGGQFSLYFKKGDSFNISNWQVPAVIDTEAYNIIESNNQKVTFSKNASLTNYSGTKFTILIKRSIQLLNNRQLGQILNIQLPNGIHSVGYRSENSITNNGADWSKANGLISIWLLGMMTPTLNTKVIIPFDSLPNDSSFITDDYFGKISSDRLLKKDHVLILRCDGRSRGKIGLSSHIARPVAGSFDFNNNVLTILSFQVDKNADYVNSKWEIQKEPYKGDVINSYNDGPLKDGSQLGPFYEIESSSPVKELKKGESLYYLQNTFHFQGNYEDMNQLAKKLLGIDLDSIKNW